MGNGIFSENFFNPVVYVPNDQLAMGIVLRYVCWGTHGPPPPPRTPAADRPTPPPPSDPQKFSHTVGCQDLNSPPPPLRPWAYCTEAYVLVSGKCAPHMIDKQAENPRHAMDGNESEMGCGSAHL